MNIQHCAHLLRDTHTILNANTTPLLFFTIFFAARRCCVRGARGVSRR